MTATYNQAAYLEALWGKLTEAERVTLGVADLNCFGDDCRPCLTGREASRLIGKLKAHIEGENLYVAPCSRR
jgi:hypothetical protein